MYGIRQACLVQNFGHFGSNAYVESRLVGANESLGKALALDYGREFCS